jgi:purine-cytosine permease-like protein
MSMEKGNFFELYKSSKGIEKPLLLICLVCSCIVPFALIVMNFPVMIGSWIIGAIAILLYNFFRKKRTKENSKVSIIPRINF